MVITKFGGTSVADLAAMKRVVGIIEERWEHDDSGPVVVVSALSKVTDQLLGLVDLAKQGETDKFNSRIKDLRQRHLEFSEISSEEFREEFVKEINKTCADCGDLVKALGVIREVSPRSLDAVLSFGELLSSRILTAALSNAGVPAAWVDARVVLVTNDAHTSATPDMAATSARVKSEITKWLQKKFVPVIGGFVGSTHEGVTTTLGRGGSDYSAAVIGACLGVSEIQIWTDVDGMLTADPRIVESPKLVQQLSFAEASELAYFGAKVLHPSTIQPAVACDIPVRILNSHRQDGPGTLITSQPGDVNSPVTAIACKRDVTVIEITSTRMLMAHGFLRRLFEVFDRFQTAVDVVTTSEVSVSVTVDDRQRLPPLLEALSEFSEVSCERDMALVCVVGSRLGTDPRLFSQIVSVLGDVNLGMVSQAASRRNITFVLSEAELPVAMTRMHDHFFGKETFIFGTAQNEENLSN